LTRHSEVGKTYSHAASPSRLAPKTPMIDTPITPAPLALELVLVEAAGDELPALALDAILDPAAEEVAAAELILLEIELAALMALLIAELSELAALLVTMLAELAAELVMVAATTAGCVKPLSSLA
jgi:hypothetical protein